MTGSRFSWGRAILAVVICRVALGWSFDLAAVCEDGWKSSSIGRPGACSHHGGVDRSASGLALIVSLLVGGVVGGRLVERALEARLEAPSRDHEGSRATSGEGKPETAPPSIPPCPY